MLPAVTPLVSVRWNKIKNRMQGRIPSKAEAAVVVASILCCPCSTEIAIGTVCLSFEISMMRGRKNSFQVQIKKNVKRTDRVDMLMGVIILVRTWNLLHPSILAASMSSFGKVLNIEVNK
jgi:hypothetical protein